MVKKRRFNRIQAHPRTQSGSHAGRSVLLAQALLTLFLMLAPLSAHAGDFRQLLAGEPLPVQDVLGRVVPGAILNEAQIGALYRWKRGSRTIRQLLTIPGESRADWIAGASSYFHDGLGRQYASRAQAGADLLTLMDLVTNTEASVDSPLTGLTSFYRGEERGLMTRRARVTHGRIINFDNFLNGSPTQAIARSFVPGKQYRVLVVRIGDNGELLTVTDRASRAGGTRPVVVVQGTGKGVRGITIPEPINVAAGWRGQSELLMPPGGLMQVAYGEVSNGNEAVWMLNRTRSGYLLLNEQRAIGIKGIFPGGIPSEVRSLVPRLLPREVPLLPRAVEFFFEHGGGI